VKIKTMLGLNGEILFRGSQLSSASVPAKTAMAICAVKGEGCHRLNHPETGMERWLHLFR